MKRLGEQALERLRRVKKWQWVSLRLVVLSSAIIWGICKTEFLKGFWGLKDDEIAVITIEKNDDGRSNLTIEDPSKSFWDVLELLGVPLVLVVLGAWFQKTQQEQSERLLKEQREQDANETREEVLQLYFDRISTLLIDKNLMTIAHDLMTIAHDKDERVMFTLAQRESLPAQIEILDVAIGVIRARTLSILRRFDNDPERKTSVMLFLAEADAISRLKIDLSNTNLNGVKLDNTNLSGAVLSGTDLSHADLSHADLSGADLSGTDLSHADLSHANLISANLRGSKLNNINLSHADLSGAKMHGVDLSSSDLSYAVLHYTKLHSANISRANLRGTDLLKANLTKAIGITTEQLELAFLCGTDGLSGANLQGVDQDRDCQRHPALAPR